MRRLSWEPGDEQLAMHLVQLDAEAAAALELRPGLQHELRLANPAAERAAVVRGAVDERAGGFGLRLSPRLAGQLGLQRGVPLTVERVELPPADRVLLRPLGELPVGRVELVARYITRVLVHEFFPLSRGMELAVAFPGVGRPQRFRVEQTEPPQARFTARTEVELLPPAFEPGEPAVSYSEIGGLGRQLEELRELLEFPLRAPQALRKAGITPCRAVLLYGPPGTGKSLMTRALAASTGVHIEALCGAELASPQLASAAPSIRESFERAAESAPAIVLIDDLDALAPRRDRLASSTQAGLVAQLLSALDGLAQREGVVVVATTSRINVLDPALRRPGRFSREIHVPPPDGEGRLEVLQIHAERMPLSPAARDALPALAERTHGYVGADLMGLCFEAGMNALRRVGEPGGDSGAGWEQALEKLEIDPGDLEAALGRQGPSALRETSLVRSQLRFDDVGGYEPVKRRLWEVVALPLARPELFAQLRLRAPRGLVLHGPPGTGKTMLVRALAGECGANCVLIKGPELLTRWVGESEERLREVFQIARQTQPCIVFVDEIDALLPARGRDLHAGVGDSLVNQFLSELDGAEGSDGVVVIGTTNRIDRLDPAALRPGRLGEIVEVGLPDVEARRAILELNLRRVPLAGPELLPQTLEAVAVASEGLSGAELAALVDHAKYRALRQALAGGEARLEPGWLLDGLGGAERAPGVHDGAGR